MILNSSGFVVRINEDGINETALQQLILSLEIICNVPILIFQFPKPHPIIMMPVELTKDAVFDDNEQLRIRLEVGGRTNGCIKEILLSEPDSNKIRQCQLNLPGQLNFTRAKAA
ncbi:hypothetical protein FEM33_16065 [Dyadobacter flavalbus]|uniref:Uncharacterized protein n=1 Tax=Dyadobacter flavalbus TaxID=2579942 RepID=A0A5M8QSL4_9BACT|nr:hypothetical protein [Dyadobacter flavalbus]KAA6438221.1 hypothetical protein FEM33_16065 [Dyadobacter flavalbus]